MERDEVVGASVVVDPLVGHEEGGNSFFGGGLPELPIEVVLAVLGHLEGADLVRAEGVCRLWREFLGTSSSLASHLWRSLHEAEFGGPVPTAPRPRGGSKKSDRKQRLHERKRGDWRLFYRYSLRTLLRLSCRGMTEQTTKDLLRWLLSCGHHAAIARLLRTSGSSAGALVHGWCESRACRWVGMKVVSVPPLKLALQSGSFELLRLLLIDESVLTGASDISSVLMTCASATLNQFGRLLLSLPIDDDTLPLATELFRAACLREELELAQAVLAQCSKAPASHARTIMTSVDGKGSTVLGQACRMKRIKAIEFLLAVLPSDCDMGRALEQAVRFCPVDVVAAMLKRGARNTGGEAIQQAALRSDGEGVLALLLQQGPAFGSDRLTVWLHTACTIASPSVEAVRLLLDRGAMPNRFGRTHHTAMQCLLERSARSAESCARKVAVARLLAERGGRLHMEASDLSRSAKLMYLLLWPYQGRNPRGRSRPRQERGEWAAVFLECLLELDPNVLPERNALPYPRPNLMEALFLSSPSIIDCFVKHGFPLSVHDRTGLPEALSLRDNQALVSLMHRAAHDKARLIPWWHDNLRALLRAGLDPNWALRFVRGQDLLTLDLLLAHGADISVLLLPLPEGGRQWGLGFAAPRIEAWLRALHERGLDFRELDFDALSDNRLALWSSLRPTKEALALAWQVITELEAESKAARDKEEQQGLKALIEPTAL